MISSIKIVSHRARGFNEPENSLDAIRQALRSQADETEIDLRHCRDGKWMANHSPFVFSKSLFPIPTSSMTSSDAEKLGLTSIVSILELLHQEQSQKTLRIELKDSVFPEQIINLCREFSLENQIVFTAWSPDLLKELHKRFPSLLLGISMIEGVSSPPSAELSEILSSVSIVPTFSRVIPSSLRTYAKPNCKLYVVANTLSYAKKLINYNLCDGILTKSPTEVIAIREQVFSPDV